QSGGAMDFTSGGTPAGRVFAVDTNAVLNVQGNIYFYGPMTNRGTVNWQGGSITLAYGSGNLGEIWNEAGALWDIQSDQAMVWWSQNEIFHNAGLLRKTAGNGTTTFYADLDNTGMLSIQSGTLVFVRDLNLPVSSLLDFPLGGTSPGSQFGRINVSGK